MRLHSTDLTGLPCFSSASGRKGTYPSLAVAEPTFLTLDLAVLFSAVD